MKTAAIVLMILVLVCGTVIGYGLFHTSLEVVGKGLQVFSAAERQNEFSSLRRAVEQNSLQGTILRNVQLGSSGDYTYHLYTLRLKNPGLVKAEMVELQVAPISQDILFYGETGESDIAPGETRDLWVMLLTEGQPHQVRDIIITYYLWGHAHEVKFTYDNTI